MTKDKTKSRCSNLSGNVGLIVPIIGYLIIVSLIAFSGSDLLLANFFHDDAFFYIKTAQNISVGLGSTFDGLNQTNGYHPLWLLFLVLISKLNPFYGFDGLKPLFLIHGILVCAITAAGWHFLHIIGASGCWRLIFTISLLGALGFSDLAVESTLFTLMGFLSLLISGCLFAEGRNRALELCLVTISFLIILSRLDAIIFQVTLALGIVVLSASADNGGAPIRNKIYIPLLIIVPSILALVLACGYNYSVFGSFETISSYLKTGFPGSFKTGWFEHSIVGIKVRMIGVFFLGIVLVSWLIPRQSMVHNENRRWEGILMSAMLYLVVHPLVLYFLAVGGIASWYFSLDTGLAILGGVYLGDRLEKASLTAVKTRSVFHFISVMMVLALVALYLYPRFHNPHRLPQLTTAKWLKDNVLTTEAVYQVDGTGFTGYFSERSVINGDGLINGREYQNAIKSGQVLEYLKKMGVRWIVTHSPHFQGTVNLTIPGWHGPSKNLGSASVEDARFVYHNYSVYCVSDFVFDQSPQTKSPD